MVRRAAFTLIELLFAIVIIAVAVTSLPMMNQVVSKGIEANIVQEAIFAAATELNEVTTAHWDENSFEVNATDSRALVIDIPSNPIRCENNASKSTYRQLIGHINQPLHRRCLNSSTTTDTNTTNNANVTSLNDMKHPSQNIFLDTTTDSTGYKQNYNSTVNVTNDADFNGASKNIKKITITITTASTTIAQLSTYSMNIGEVDYFKKEY